jgi:hypothetical protein
MTDYDNSKKLDGISAFDGYAQAKRDACALDTAPPSKRRIGAWRAAFLVTATPLVFLAGWLLARFFG